MTDFFQQGPILGNPFAADPLLQAFLRWRLPADLQETLASGLLAFGQRVVDEVQELGPQAESHPPRHIPFNAWGERVDQIEVSGAWQRLQNIAAREGLGSKPAPDMFLFAARAIGVDPARAVVFEDAISGVAAARAGAFALVIGVDRGTGEEALRAHGADLVIDDLAAFV